MNHTDLFFAITILAIFLLVFVTVLSIDTTARVTYAPPPNEKLASLHTSPQPVIYLQNHENFYLYPDKKFKFSIGEQHENTDIVSFEFYLVQGGKKTFLNIQGSPVLINLNGGTDVLWDVPSQYADLPEGTSVLTLTMKDHQGHTGTTSITINFIKSGQQSLPEQNTAVTNNQDTQEKTALHDTCTCQRMIVKLTGIADDSLALPGENFGSPEPTDKEGPTKNLGPSAGTVKIGPYKDRFRVGYTFEIKADIKGNPAACKTKQNTKGTIIYTYTDGRQENIKSHNIGQSITNTFVENGNAGYNSRVWAPDDYTHSLDYCTIFQQNCDANYHIKESKNNVIQWIDSPGAWLRKYSKTYKSSVYFESTVQNSNQQNECSCLLDMETLVDNEEGKRNVRTNTVKYLGGKNCHVETTPKNTNNENNIHSLRCPHN